MMRRRRGGERLLAHRDGGTWSELSSGAVNAYLAGLFGGDFTAKDFRTWHATVIAAEALALTSESGRTQASRKRAEREAIGQVAVYLGNTPTVARSAYVDPRVLDAYASGLTISAAATRSYRSVDARQAGLERAVRELLGIGST
jgi:DNA topoisomerase IB